jgi:hypothetical protein
MDIIGKRNTSDRPEATLFGHQSAPNVSGSFRSSSDIQILQGKRLASPMHLERVVTYRLNPLFLRLEILVVSPR